MVEEVKTDRIHDLTNMYWGHAIEWMYEETEEEPGKVSGHLRPSVQEGDYIALKMESGNVALYELTDVKNIRDPRDMFFATATRIRYMTEEDEYLKKGFSG